MVCSEGHALIESSSSWVIIASPLLVKLVGHLQQVPEVLTISPARAHSTDLLARRSKVVKDERCSERYQQRQHDERAQPDDGLGVERPFAYHLHVFPNRPHGSEPGRQRAVCKAARTLHLPQDDAMLLRDPLHRAVLGACELPVEAEKREEEESDARNRKRRKEDQFHEQGEPPSGEATGEGRQDVGQGELERSGPERPQSEHPVLREVLELERQAAYPPNRVNRICVGPDGVADYKIGIEESRNNNRVERKRDRPGYVVEQVYRYEESARQRDREPDRV